MQPIVIQVVFPCNIIFKISQRQILFIPPQTLNIVNLKVIKFSFPPLIQVRIITSHNIFYKIFFSFSSSQINQQIINIFGFCQNIFRMNQIDVNGCKVIADALKSWPNLTDFTLDIKQNQLKDEGILAISSALVKCPNLSTLTLRLQFNQITPMGKLTLVSLIQKCNKLSIMKLNFYQNQFNKEVDSQIIKITLKFKRLVMKYLYL
ncbi:hypothetical protein TTHERM_000753691 (macronuclear) [Tetrahymena thermophila SB210]|uniref:Kinase domain protein n=1 Tax=Tetrahymena thermophila (strain SB210) TaxID=312017 RepID=W7XJ39_TETTS|nr:hypothetical protein TTHERM_000753691 [Tetrahymena thermophila SB210]EWS73829.1 hypothetical protein TTHERM_000753691 [Tetrahymena thermophila SB210]|eukprot:XP_012653652.1 hypothetical protein TTHERM_000753691 [Tetrahymena thermophila SB210]